MKTIFKVLLFVLAALLFTQCEKDEPNPEVTIPDNNFLNAIIERGIDTDGDSIISYAEAAEVTFLSVWSDDISDMTGIEAFINLDTLRCSFNQLTTLDVSNNTSLLELSCYTNQLSALDVSNNTALEYLECGQNQLSTLDVSNNTALQMLDISEMPSLYEVCVWTLPFVRLFKYTSGSPNVYFTTECSE